MKRWEDFQKDFSAAITRPLEAGSGTLLPVPHAWAVYNRQYWIRLFTTMQNEYPTLAKLLGCWRLNLLTQAFIQAHPPESYDLAAIAVPFIPWLREQKQPPLILQAAALDHLRQQILQAPAHQPWQLTAEAASNLAEVQLKAAPSWGIFQENWELTTWLGQGLPTPRTTPQHWLIRRRNLQMIHEPLSPAQAAFYELLRERSMGAALAALPDLAREIDLPMAIEAWMRQGMEWDLWAL